jgi:hypothetical protein
MAGVYFLVGVLFLYSWKGKLIDDDGHAPPALEKQFEGTFYATFPGIDAVWVILGILELAIFLLIVASLVRGEFLPGRPKSVLLAGLALALLTFACLSFGQTSTGNTAGTASLYTYFGATVVIILLVLRMPAVPRARLAPGRAQVSPTGISTWIWVPRSGGLSISRRPLRASTRAARPRSPEPPAGSAPPTPSSATVTSARPLARRTLTVTCEACAYFATFASASEMT